MGRYANTGGFLGYHLAKDRSERGHGWGSGRGWGRCQQQQPTAPVDSGTFEKPSQPVNIAPDEFALFQQWKQQQSSSFGGRPAFPPYAQAPAYNVDAVKASAVESADKALDVILSQVQGMKEVSTDRARL